ncbi:thioesterase [Desulfobacter hydrogenophilus]|uniref:Thioesterase n=1 Tax=Desulfobacter hydrogenophilus TaxID=2291 RepID=A0A328FEF2_9BACT|nr:hotdog fold thioesterase [Desulfobacter hydrogenophilus]NDY71499.1 hotdog fold thioesterase [Desulfobacter hydrogenophilus]QBH11883.1 hotdog fold thioesterase [Desulfobacter hydrogenophilus]RAM02526.1 thioesterase [Desulfobacter hydrogenophilus]
MIWKKEFTVDDMNRFKENTMIGLLDITFEEKGENFLTASMPVDARTHQPMGILHGGASVVLAETLGSCAAQMVLEKGFYSVGLEIKANHIKSVSQGRVTGRTTPLHIGRTTQVWDIDIKNDKGELICASRLTMAVLETRKKHS